MRYIIILILIFTCSSIKAQTIDLSSTYELHIKDQKILDALSVCFSNFDEYTKANKLTVFKVYASYLSPDELEMTIDFYSPKDTIEYTQPDNFFKFGEKIAFVYFGKNILTKMYDPNFHTYVLSVCREKMKFNNSNGPKFSNPNETKPTTNTSSTNPTKPTIIAKVLPRGTQGLVLERTFTFDPTLKYFIRKVKDKVEITALKSGTI